jgi:hypothetical protein
VKIANYAQIPMTTSGARDRARADASPAGLRRRPDFQISGKGISGENGYASSRMAINADRRKAILKRRCSSEARMHIGTVLLVIWLVIGAIAAGQRGDFKHSFTCSNVTTTAVTVLAGPLNYADVNPHISCSTPKPSK